MVASRANKEAVVRTYRKASASAVGCLLAAAVAMTAGEARAFSVIGAYGAGISIGPGARTSVAEGPNPFGGDPLAQAALDRRCPEILADPTWYDDDIIALCLRARKRRHAAVDGER